MKNKKIGIRGAYGERNFGDDALMYFLYKWAKKNNLEASFIGKKASYISNIISSQKYILKENFHRYFFETLIYGGGTQFFSFENNLPSTSKLKLLVKHPSLFFKKARLALEKKIGYKQKNYKSIYSVGIGLGPFLKKSEMEQTAKQKVKAMQGVFVRDKFSYKFAKACNDNTFLSTDICFLPDVIDFVPYLNSSVEIKNIGIVLRDWNYSTSGKRYLSRVIDEAKKLSENYQIDFILFKDEPQCELAISNLEFNVVKWNPETQGLSDFIKILSGYDLFISSRFHGVIFGALLHIPSIAIEIEPKLRVTKELLQDGVEVWEQPFLEELDTLISNINYKEAKTSLKNAVEKHSALASEMFDNLLERIKTSVLK